jgi:Pyruvate/2-oxoacid:ferredoxin oxidoreductase delta subunit
MGAGDRAALARLLLERGLEVSCRRDTGPADLPGGVVVGNPGDGSATDWLSDQHIDAATLDPQTLATRIEEGLNRGGRASGSDAGAQGPWKPWFPVIDYSRCTNCMQCLSFCLFDVYGVSADSKIQVQNQSNCKTECPACSRVCPEVAIMFPKYRHGPINGEEVKADDVRREAMKVDISALLGGDVYSMLRDRSAKAKSRFSRSVTTSGRSKSGRPV